MVFRALCKGGLIAQKHVIPLLMHRQIRSWNCNAIAKGSIITWKKCGKFGPGVVINIPNLSIYLYSGLVMAQVNSKKLPGNMKKSIFSFTDHLTFITSSVAYYYMYFVCKIHRV